MSNPDKVKFIISHGGDSSVGIAGEKAEVLLDASGFNAEDRANFIENARDSLTKAFASIWEFKPSVRTEAELQAEGPTGAPYTVIGHDEYERTLFIEHVVATDGLNAFAVAAAKHPDAEFAVAIEGTLTEAGNVLTLPGEGLVPSGVILTSPDVFGTAQKANDGPDGP
jgi:hypothetical protein